MTLALIILCVISPAGCSDKNNPDDEIATDEMTAVTDMDFNLTQGVYIFEEKNFNVDPEATITDYLIKDNYLYFTYIKYPEYSEEYIEEDEAEEEKKDNKVEQETVDKKEDTSETDEIEYLDIQDDIPDEELLGDLDEIFGTGDEEENVQTETPQVQEPEEIAESDVQENMIENVFCRYDLETGEITKMYNIENDGTKECEEIAVFMDDDGNKQTLTLEYDYNGAMTVAYTITDSVGKVISNEDVTEYFIKEGDNPDEISIEYSQAIAEDGTMYIAVYRADKAEIVRFKDGKVEDGITIDSYLAGVAVDNENRPLAVIEDDVSKIVYLDFENKAIGDVIYQPEDEYISGEVISGKANILFFLKTTAGLSAFDKDTKEKKDILNWLDCGLLADNVVNIMPCKDGRLLCVYMDDSGMYKVGFLIRQEGAQTQKKVVEVVSLYTNYDLQERIIDFNKISDNCKIEYRTYEDMEDSEKAFANDIIAGKIPDIIDITSMDINNFMAKGLFEDLSPYIEKDKEINREYFLDGVLDVTSRDGKNYFVVKYFALTGLTGKESEYGKYADGWTLKDMMESYNSKKSEKYLVPYESKSTVAYEFLYSDINSYVDWNTGEVNFDNDIFKEGLEFCNSFTDEEEEEFDVYKEIQNDRLMLNNVYISEFSEMQLMEKMYDGDIAFLGIPSENKRGMSFVCASDAYAISSTSECKDEAWEFIKHVMLSKDEVLQGFPSSQAEFDKYVKRETTTVEYTEKDGTVVKPKEELIEYDSFEVKITELKKDMVEELKELLKKSVMVSEEYEISTLVEEDVDAYFDGSKTLDDTIEIIQDKVSKYVNENR